MLVPTVSEHTNDTATHRHTVLTGGKQALLSCVEVLIALPLRRLRFGEAEICGTLAIVESSGMSRTVPAVLIRR